MPTTHLGGAARWLRAKVRGLVSAPVQDPLLEPDERRLTPEEFREHFGDLPTDGEG